MTLVSGHQLQWVSQTHLFYTTINSSMRPDTAIFLDVETGEQGESGPLVSVVSVLVFLLGLAH